MANNNLKKKLVVIGDPRCGKTMLINHFLRNAPFNHVEMEHCIEFYAEVPHPDGDEKIYVTIAEIHPDVPAGQRCRAYSNVDAIILCYAVDDLGALPQIRDMWVPEMNQYMPDTPIFVAGLKCDKRLPNLIHQNGLIPAHSGSNLRLRYDFVSYTECSAIRSAGVNTLFNQVLRYVPPPPQDEVNHN